MDFIEKFYDHAAIYMEYKKIGISKWNSDTVQKNYSYMNLVIQIEIQHASLTYMIYHSYL